LLGATVAIAIAVLASCGGDRDRTGGISLWDASTPIDSGPRPDGWVPPPPIDGGGPPGYSEPTCEPLADVSDLEASYTSTAWRTTLETLADRRYPYASETIRAVSDDYLLGWVDTRSFAELFGSFETAAHESNHLWDFSHSTGSLWHYRLRPDLEIDTQYLSDFPRSEILTIHPNPSADFYAPPYLMMLGSEGFSNLLDEYVAYVHSLASRYCTREDLTGGFSTSARDGVLAFMHYVELYLKLARTEHPDDYAEIVGDPAHIELILTNWDRAEFWLAITESHPELGINDEMYEAWAYDPANLMEIEYLRAL